MREPDRGAEGVHGTAGQGPGLGLGGVGVQRQVDGPALDLDHPGRRLDPGQVGGGQPVAAHRGEHLEHHTGAYVTAEIAQHLEVVEPGDRGDHPRVAGQLDGA
ncbi:hypothetical protein SDC9_85037 [bioreactor metagenome]|uniref:Uncharacterized protein n=1 Tax=bioreactor metagenome TaxID=1076179 RepID=A0A644ZDM2_9ZZZZ